MKRKAWIFLASWRLLAPILLLAPPAAPSQPTVVSGTFTFTAAPTLIRIAGGNIFLDFPATLVYSGGLSGTAFDSGPLIVHPDGSSNFYGTEAGTAATIDGRTGDFTAVFAGSISATGQVEGRLIFTSGTGGLAGLHGEGIFFSCDAGFCYSFKVQFAP